MSDATRLAALEAVVDAARADMGEWSGTTRRALGRAYDHPASIGRLAIQSTASRDRALGAAQEKREQRASKRAMVAAAQEPGT